METNKHIVIDNEGNKYIYKKNEICGDNINDMLDIEHYYKIDVFGQNGYSFMIETNEELHDKQDAIELALDNNLFEDPTDADIADVDDIILNYDIEHFKSCGCCYYIDLHK